MTKILAFLILIVFSIIEVVLNVLCCAIITRIVNNLTKGKFISWVCELYSTEKGGK